MPQEKEFMIGPVQYTLRENGTAAVTGCLPIVTKVELRSLVHGAIVTEIAEKAFCQDHLLAEVVFPNTLQKIGKEAFCGCESLRKVELPDEISELEECCFGQCFQLRDVHFPKQLRVIGEYAFKDCISLGRIEIPAGCTEIAHNAFEECPSLTEFVVDDENDVYTSVDGILYTKDMSLLLRCPESRRLPVTLACGMEFAREAFDRCMWLPAIEVEEGHQRYSSIDGVLYNAEGDTLELLPQGRRKPLHLTAEIVDISDIALDQSFMPVQQILEDGMVDFAWIDCCSLQPFEVDADNPAFSDVDGVLYDKEQTVLIACFGDFEGVLQIPDSVTVIDCGAVSGCGKVTSVILPDDLQIIDNAAFSGCVALESLDVPASVTEIGMEAFLSCFALQKLTIRGMNTTIGKDALMGCLNVSICAPVGSAAEQYAAEWDVPFEPLTDE